MGVIGRVRKDDLALRNAFRLAAPRKIGLGAPGVAHLKDEMMPRYAETVYNGFWFSPEREMMQAAIDKASEKVTGTVRLKLYKGNVIVTGRKSPVSLYSEETATFEADQVFDQRDSEGFIKLNALRLRLARTRGD